MIQINLIPLREKKRRRQLLVGVYAGTAAGALLIGLGWLHVRQVSEQKRLKAEIARVEAEAKPLEGKIQEIRAVEAQKAKVQELEADFQKVAGSQRRILAALDRLALAVPEGLWLTQITQDSNNPNLFLVQGRAFSELAMRSFVNALRAPGGALGEATLKILSTGQTFAFEVQAKMPEAKK